ncbi:hypothetical protein JX266_012618, partial [Neoarthrinium moseri]
KYLGYKSFASAFAIDPDFFAVRRFDRLHARAILTLQAQLVELECKLDELDKRYSAKSCKVRVVNGEFQEVVETANNSSVSDDAGETLVDINNGSVRVDIPERASLVKSITLKLAEYDRALLDYASVLALGSAPSRNVQNIKIWLQENPGAIVKREASFIEHQYELVAIAPSKSPLRRWFEDYVLFPTRKSLAWFRKTPHPSLRPEAHLDVHLTSNDAIDVFAAAAIFLAVAVMLIMPLWILQALTQLKWKLVVITVFIVVCLAFLSVAAVGNSLGRIGATAG